MQKINEIQSKIQIATERTKDLQSANLEEPDANMRRARAAAMEPITLSIEIDRSMLSLLQGHEARIKDIELVIKPLKDAQTTHKTIVSWSKIATPLLWLITLCSACYSAFLHITHVPK